MDSVSLGAMVLQSMTRLPGGRAETAPPSPNSIWQTSLVLVTQSINTVDHRLKSCNVGAHSMPSDAASDCALLAVRFQIRTV